MGGMDWADQFWSYNGFGHRTVRWWRRAFIFLLDMAVVNSYIIYTLRNPDKRRRLTHAQIRVQLARDLLHASGECTAAQDDHHGRHHHPLQPAARLTLCHYPTVMGLTLACHPLQKDCCVCIKRRGQERKTTMYMCRECSLPMCIVPCFELHHTKTHPQSYLD